ncbi:DUF2993 domain-containing protein [Leucobacter rhizosphaerae]|uniref:DUF2993 domain-containing protein n=1 Tax=Leucobacter rhizosphaerae TaxID=2932245 RepID=A0ABY4FVE5_9MICO|nr:DUF2993 domain-containing protein [Leucobacter rhizosphaerae]UOQ60255.1 DUF2993 domain-containing protein [Leucobacter rhizosphaerae]
MSERRPRWWLRILGVVVALGLLAGAAEVALRLIIPGVIAGAVRSQLNMTDDHPVDVSLGGSALFSAVRGEVGDVTIAVPNVPLLEGVETDASLHAAAVPFDPTSGEISDGTVELVVPKDQLGAVVDLVTSGVAQTGEVRDGALVVGRSIEMFGQEVQLSASIGITVVDGAVEIEPLGVKAAGFDFTAEQISAATGSLLDPVLQPQTVCVRDQLPAGVTLTDISLSSTGSATIRASLAPGILSDPAQQAQGTCG